MYIQRFTGRLVANNCVQYRNISTADDTDKLQHDLDRLQECENDWQIELHPKKCQISHISKKKKKYLCNKPYNIHWDVLEVVDTGKYLGVNIHENISKKANTTITFIQKHSLMSK